MLVAIDDETAVEHGNGCREEACRRAGIAEEERLFRLLERAGAGDDEGRRVGSSTVTPIARKASAI